MLCSELLTLGLGQKGLEAAGPAAGHLASYIGPGGGVHPGAASPGQHVDVLVLLHVSAEFGTAAFFHDPLPQPQPLWALAVTSLLPLSGHPGSHLQP